MNTDTIIAELQRRIDEAHRGLSDQDQYMHGLIAGLGAAVDLLRGPPRPVRRKPQNPQGWPPTLTPEQIEERINRLCGCAGQNDCDCVSVFNRACGEAWSEHNEKPGPAA